MIERFWIDALLLILALQIVRCGRIALPSPRFVFRWFRGDRSFVRDG